MPGVSQSSDSASQVELELYFLIARFLSAGPCKESAKVLRKELDQHKLLPKRIDWEGSEHPRTFENLCEVNRHIKSDHLLKICQRLGPLLENEVPPSVRGVQSLLGAGRQSLCRTKEDVKNTYWPPITHLVCHHGEPLMPPRNLSYTPNLVNILNAGSMSGRMRRDHSFPAISYKKMTTLSRSLGHLSAVYCVTFDMTGEYIITGADDHLIKIWSALSGRLLATLRGHSAEITDMAVNFENTMLATGSCDKFIRVWCLKSCVPLAILHGHTGTITSLQFCPFARGDSRFLVSTGGDGCVCFWQWSASANTFNSKPFKFVERSRAGAQMLCSSFSPGGVFLATGSSDQVIRVYCFTSAVPEKICELEAHSDRVDSIQYGNLSNRFLSGSKDGTARIWRYERQEWKAIMLNMTTKLPTKNPSTTIGNGIAMPTEKLQVTMVKWTQDDNYVITAVTNCTLKVWDSHTGTLISILEGHADEVFVLENNPKEPDILLSAGHDGNIIIWNIITGQMLTKFFNMIEGQGHGAVFDCKWSPDALSFAATDSHGFTMLFGFGSNERYKQCPEEQFFHTDYRPLIRDSNNYVLDEQTQQAPHLMPPPFLVDVDGLPHPPRFQRLVPGRENAKGTQLIPQIGVAPSGNREVLDDPRPILPNQDDAPGPAPAQEDENENNENGEEPQIIDALIERMQREQDERIAQSGGEPLLRSPRSREPSSPGAANRGPLSPTVRGPRRSGEVEGVRQVSGNVPVSQRATKTNMATWANRVLIKEVDPAVLRKMEEWRHDQAEEEIKTFVVERKKKPAPISENDSSDSCTYMRTRTKKKSNHSYRTRANNSEVTGRNRLTARALYDTEEEEMPDSHPDTEVESEGIWNSEKSSSSESDDYSDWAQDGGSTLQPPKRQSQRQPKKKKLTSSESEVDPVGEPSPVRPKRKKPQPKPQATKRERKARQQRKQVMEQKDQIQELPEEFRPPEWLTDTIPRKAPYVPQMGDEVIYFRQGHELYVHFVKKKKVYEINPNKNQPWHKRPNLREQELVKIVGIKYECRPPRLACLKLANIDPSTGKLTGATFTIKYHDMPDVIDFLVLRQIYDIAMRRNWVVGDRFRSMIDDAWWMGTIHAQEPFQADFPDSMWQCFLVHWDNGEAEKMSPWDLEPIDETDLPNNVGGCVVVTPEELKSLMYTPTSWEWPECGRDEECERIMRGLETIMELSIAEAFLVPVDLNIYPLYGMIVEYPIDLSTIKARIENRYYRRVTSIQYDVRYIETNAKQFNEPSSQIVKCAKLVTEVCLRFISDKDAQDPMSIYASLTQDIDFAIVPVQESSDSDEGEGTSSNRGKKSANGSKIKNRSVKLDSNAWKSQCKVVLRTMLQCDDSVPFRAPVDPIDYPDYHEYVDESMDLGTVKEQLDCDNYDNPSDFCKDVRLVFNNSKAYNTNKRSRIYAMTLRLSALFDEQIRDILEEYKAAMKYERTGRVPHSFRKRTSPGMSQSNMASRSQRRARILSREEGPSTSGHESGTMLAPPVTRLTRSGSSVGLRSSASGLSSRSGSSNRDMRESRIKATTKRRRISSTGEDEESGEESSDGEESSSSDEESEEISPTTRRSQRKRPPPKRARQEPVNGHTTTYATRNRTGTIKRKKYGSSEEEEEEEVAANDKDSESDTSDSKSGSESSSEDNDSSESESEEGNQSEDSGPTRRSARNRERRKVPVSKVKNSYARPKPRPIHPSRTPVSRTARNGDSLRRGTRNQGKRTVQYTEDFSDGENGEDMDSDKTEDYSDFEETQEISISSRGRVRKLTPRARAMMVDS